MKRIYTRIEGHPNDGPADSNFSAWMHDDGSLMIRVPTDGLAPFLAEKHILSFINALRRAYADRYDIVHAKARRSAAKGI